MSFNEGDKVKFVKNLNESTTWDKHVGSVGVIERVDREVPGEPQYRLHLDTMEAGISGWFYEEELEEVKTDA